jgi:hydrogenase nickel incorporation protein HypA/HybF
MHELAVTESLLQVVLRRARESGAEKVLSVGVRIGGLSDLVNEWVQRYFDHLSRGTIAEGAVIRIERIPTTFRCQGCGHAFPAEPRTRETVCCPFCSSIKIELVSGRECLVQQIEVI